MLSKGVPKHPQKQYNAKAAKKLDYHKLSIRLTSVGALGKVQVTIAAILQSTFCTLTGCKNSVTGVALSLQIQCSFCSIISNL